jgi:hypothetical protein
MTDHPVPGLRVSSKSEPRRMATSPTQTHKATATRLLKLYGLGQLMAHFLFVFKDLQEKPVRYQTYSSRLSVGRLDREKQPLERITVGHPVNFEKIRRLGDDPSLRLSDLREEARDFAVGESHCGICKEKAHALYRTNQPRKIAAIADDPPWQTSGRLTLVLRTSLVFLGDGLCGVDTETTEVLDRGRLT